MNNGRLKNEASVRLSGRLGESRQSLFLIAKQLDITGRHLGESSQSAGNTHEFCSNRCTDQHRQIGSDESHTALDVRVDCRFEFL